MFTGIRGIMQMSLNEEQMLSVITRCGSHGALQCSTMIVVGFKFRYACGPMDLQYIYIDMSYTLVSHNLTIIMDIYRPSYIAFHFTPPCSISVWSDGKLPSCIRISPKIWVNLRHLGVHSFLEMESPCLVWRRYFEHITLEILERCLGEFEELLHFKCLPSKKGNDGPLWLSSVQQGKTPNGAFVGTFWKWWRVGSEQLMGYLLVDTGSTWLHAINIYQSVLRQYFPYDAGHGSSLCFKCHQYASGISTHHQPRHEVPQDDDIHCGAVRGNRGKPGCAKDVQKWLVAVQPIHALLWKMFKLKIR